MSAYSEPAQVAIVDDDSSALSWLAECVRSESRLRLAGTFRTLQEARAWFDDHDADVLLTDLGLPDGSGLELIRQVAARLGPNGRPRTDVLVISIFGDAETVLDAIEAGAVGYLHKDAPRPDIAQTILDIREGASPISPMVARGLLARFRQSTADEPQRKVPSLDVRRASAGGAGLLLTAAESEVLSLIARGLTYAEIGHQRGVSIGTVQSQVKSVYGKLAVHSRTQAIRAAHSLGLIDIRN